MSDLVPAARGYSLPLVIESVFALPAWLNLKRTRHLSSKVSRRSESSASIRKGHLATDLQKAEFARLARDLTHQRTIQGRVYALLIRMLNPPPHIPG
jgi:hypothetical protein